MVGAATSAAAPASAPARKAKAVKAKAPKKAARKAEAQASAAKYSDGAGRTWTGRGRQPQWFKDALAAGKKPEELQA
ncbi:MAG: H-NS histone family protein [Burkholderiales bacterium]|nr:H-NS histone family protein [Burkholderiales bacterium]MDE1926624.1 H-NS histone family protein [Burkholderiales bacterium]MDE2160347.1 H-NS histone family protein [Burkholderiales bacterium]MDE2503989.1 H-NS histone family protein [Burkholderiales bacterium]